MKVRVTPEYGFGGFRLTDDNMAIETPVAFTFEATVLEPGFPFVTILGLVTEPGHPLSGRWVSLWQRTRGEAPTYNLQAFKQKPDDPLNDRPELTGFATAEPAN